MYVVLGANGRVGGETARALMASGKPTRVVLRRPEQAKPWLEAGAQVAICSIEDVTALSAALRGASGAFLLCPPPMSGNPYQIADKLGEALARAVEQAELSNIVALSSIGAQHKEGTGVIATLNTLESHLREKAPSTTFLRPGYFIETWGEVASVVADTGVLPSFFEPFSRVPMVSTLDVGRAAAQLISDDVAGNRIVELRGPQDWSANDVAVAFSVVLRRAVDVAFVPPEARAAILAQDGVPSEVADALVGMYEGIASGRVEHEEGAEQRRGTVALRDAIERMLRMFVSAELPGRLLADA